MDIRDHRGLKHAADRSLAMAAYSPLKLIFIHTAVALALSLGVTALDFVLEGQIGNTGGLSGMGIRSVLTTIQTMLRMVEFAILPFWEMGYIFTVMRLARVESARPENLLTGFFRSGAANHFAAGLDLYPGDLRQLLSCHAAFPAVSPLHSRF